MSYYYYLLNPSNKLKSDSGFFLHLLTFQYIMDFGCLASFPLYEELTFLPPNPRLCPPLRQQNLRRQSFPGDATKAFKARPEGYLQCSSGMRCGR